MKIGILTHYNVSSHGAVLQMYAMQEVLKELGHEVYILTYHRNTDFVDEDTRRRFSASIRNMPWYIKKYLFTNGFSVLLYQYRKQKILAKFRSECFHHVPYTESGKMDCVIVGADEVFALEDGINFMMFGHGITSKRLISYAPSFGQTDFARIEKYGFRALIASGLSRFDALSVRDESSKNIVDVLVNRDVPVICDPALLYNFSVETESTKPREQYIVIYSYQSNFKDPERIEAIRAFARKKQCKLYSVGSYYKWCDKKINCDPLTMLRVFGRAAFVITDTFHGTIMSVITETPMAVFVRENNNVKLEHLLSILGLTNRKVSQNWLLEQIAREEVDFVEVRSRVKKCRDEGLAYLLEALGDS